MAEKFKPPSLDTYQGQFTPPSSDTLQPDQPGVVERFTNAAGGQGIADVFRSVSDPAARERTGKRVAGIVEGIKSEPGRVLGEVKQFGQNLASGNLMNAAENVGRAVPFLGAPTVGIAHDIETDQYPEAFGHALQTYGPFAAKYAPRAAEVAGEGARLTKAGVVGGIEGGMERVPLGKPFGIDFGETRVPASLKWGMAFGLPSEGLGLARGSLTSGIGPGLFGAAIPVARGVYRGVKAARSGVAEAAPLAELDEISQALAGKKYQNLSAGEQQQITNIQAKARQRNISAERPDYPLPPRDPNAPIRSPYEEVQNYLKEQRRPRGSVVERNPVWKDTVQEPSTPTSPYQRPPASEVSITGRAPGGLEVGEYLRNQPRPETRPPLWKGLVPEAELPPSAFSASPFSEPIIPSQPFRRAAPRAESPGAFDALVKAARKRRK